MTDLRRLLFTSALALTVAAGCGDDEAATGGGGSGGGSGGSGGSGAEKLEGPAGQWTFIPVEGMVCGTGTATGVGINPSASGDAVLFFFQGGGACFNAGNCIGDNAATANFEGFGEAQLAMFANGTGARGMLDRSDPENPFRDHHYVFFPYCTGDVHIGNRITADDLHFVGHQNLRAAMPRILATHPAPSAFAVAGQSAGGFGAMFNFYVFGDAYPGVDGQLVDDSGPFFPLNDAPALSFLLSTYDLASTVAAGCADCVAIGEDTAGLHNLIPHYASAYPDARLSLISSYGDDVIAPRFMLDAASYEMLLEALADQTVPLNPNMRVYYLQGTHHVWTDGDEGSGKLGDVVSDGVTLATFLQQQVGGDTGWANVRP